MKIKKVQYEKLFGFFDYSIDFNETVTIIHGPNGCGKTTMLKIIDAAFNKKLDVLKTTDFKSVKFHFSNSSILKIERKRAYLNEHHERNTGIIYLAYTITENDQSYVFDTFENSSDYLATIGQFLKGYRPFPWLERMTNNMWFDKRQDEKISTEEVVARYGSIIYKRYGRDLLDEEIPEQVQALLHEIDVRLISADRLTIQKRVERQYSEDSIKIERRVDNIANNLSEKIRDAIQQYAQLSQAKDRTFPLRAIKQTSPMSVDQIKEKLLSLKQSVRS